ncbi:MAG: NAD(P)H-hydrate epimerase [Phycisphaerae bacterium]
MRSMKRDEVRRIDRYAIETLGVPAAVLMENAGRHVADAACEMLGNSADASVAVVAGGGNNAGDGFVAARHLTIRGVRAVVFLTAPREKITGHAGVNLEIIVNLGLDVRDVGEGALPELSAQLTGFDLVVDAVGGTGISGALRGASASVVEQINAAGRPVLAVDIPTGLDCDTGEASGPAVKADRTVTFVARKAGFDCPVAGQYTGDVRVVDIGIPTEKVARLAGIAD